MLLQRPTGDTLLLFLACTALSLHILDIGGQTRWHNMVHRAIAGLAIGFLPNRQKIGVSGERDAWMEILIMALIGSLVGIAIGTVRRAVGRRFGRPAKWCDVDPIAKEVDEFAPAFLQGSA